MSIPIFSTAASRYYAERLATAIPNATLHQTERTNFDDGEAYYRLEVEDLELLGKDVIFVGSTHTDADLLEMYRVGSGLAGHGTRRRIFVIPYFGYSTMERAVQPGEIVTAKKNARLLSDIPNTGGGNVFLMFDLHTPGLVHYFEGDCLRYELSGESLLSSAIATLNCENCIMGSADLGRPRRIQELAERFHTDIAFVSKSRAHKEVRLRGVIGDVHKKQVIIYDDMTRSGKSLIQAGEAYLKQGAQSIHAVLSHLALTEEGIDNLLHSPLEHIIGTDTHPMSQHPKIQKSDKFTVVSTVEVFARAVERLLS